MATMVRKQIYIRLDQDALLEKLSRKLHIPEATIIRQGIDYSLKLPLWSPFDLTTWQKEKQYIKQLMKKGSVKGGRSWKRDDLYE